MSAPPYQKFFWGSYHKHTAHLGHAREHGAYLLLIGALWNNDGRLPADDETLAGYAKVSLKEWEAIKPKLVNGTLLKVVRGKLTQPRVTDDLAKYKDTSGKRKRAGKSGGLASAEKQRENRAANAAILPTKPEPEPEPEREEGDGVVEARAPELVVVAQCDWPQGDARKHAQILIEQINSPWLDPSKSLGLVTTVGRLDAWKRDGASWDHDVVPVVTALCAKRRSPIGTWKFFDDAIARSIADNRAALQIPALDARHERTHHDKPPSARDDRISRMLAGAVAAIDGSDDDLRGGGIARRRTS